ncbi:hypothetical protein T11_471 [Trichinella zimbabwensis]|uniref:Uncharacterized protein n=1 Tax=Trichinella zimbabwensis TaxID=268475 RepID=A0A0V1I414_9BILA|nr:hypothetical protein T11_471 [Trichinella zimbabwensis]
MHRLSGSHADTSAWLRLIDAISKPVPESTKLSDVTSELGKFKGRQSNVPLTFGLLRLLGARCFHFSCAHQGSRTDRDDTEALSVLCPLGHRGVHIFSIQTRFILFLEEVDSTVHLFRRDELSFDHARCNIVGAQLFQLFHEELKSSLQRDQLPRETISFIIV